MAISLADIKQNTIGPPRIVIYGVHGIGKTALAACAPNTIFIPVEEGLGKFKLNCFPKLESYKQALETLDALIREANPYDWVVIDGLDELEAFWQADVARRAGKPSVAEIGYSKGYDRSAELLRDEVLKRLDILRSVGKAIILIGHAVVEKFDDPERDAYDRYQPQLHKKALPVIANWADAILFLNYKVTSVDKGSSDRKRGVGSGQRVIYTTERPSFKAKNRYGLPHEIAIPDGDPCAAWQVIEGAISNCAQELASTAAPAPAPQPEPAAEAAPTEAAPTA